MSTDTRTTPRGLRGLRARGPRTARPPRRVPIGLVLGLLVVLAWAVVAIWWPQLAPFDPDLQDPSIRFQEPGGEHLLGTDQFGRDTFSRMLAGARPVLQVAPLATVLAVVAGTLVGLLAATYGGWVDNLVMRVLDAVMVFPAIIASVLLAAMMGRSVTMLVIVIAVTFTPIVARGVRSAALVERRRAYAEAAILRNEPGWSLMLRELLPNVTGAVLVEATSRLGGAIFLAATLSFLGLGQPPGSSDWGTSIADNRAWLTNAPWTVLAPAAAIASLVVAVALVTDELHARSEAR